MENINKVHGSLSLMLFAGALILAPVAQAQECKPLTVQVNHEMGVGTPTAQALEWYGNAITEDTGGKVKFRYFHTHQLGSERETFDMLQSGSVQMGVSGAQIVSALAPEYGALLLPYAFSDKEHFGRVLDSDIGKDMHQKFLDTKGIRILGWAHRAPRHLTTSKKRVGSPEDLKGLKIRIRQIPVQVDAFRVLGASPVPMAFPEVYTGLQTGVIDGQENPASIMDANSFSEVQKYLILTSHIREAFWWEISERVWDKMCVEYKDTFQKHISRAIEMSNELEAAEDQDYIDALGKKGMEIVELSSDVMSQFSDKMSEVADKYKDEWRPGLYDEMLKLR